MNDKTFEATSAIDSYYIISTVWSVLIIIFIFIFLYYLRKLYLKLIRFLDSNTKDGKNNE